MNTLLICLAGGIDAYKRLSCADDRLYVPMAAIIMLTAADHGLMVLLVPLVLISLI